MTSQPSILCLPDMDPSPEALALLRRAGHVDVLPQPTRARLLQCIGQYHACMATLEIRFDQPVIERACRLRVLATPSTGLDHLDMPLLRERGIEVLSLKDERAFLDGITATAELAWGLLLAAVRRIPAEFDDTKRGIWHRPVTRGRQLSGKTLGIIGFGRLGNIVSQYAHAFRMRVLATDPVAFAHRYVQRVGFHELLAESDVVSVHVHLNDQTHHLLDRDAFARMKPGVVLVNTSRGGIIDEQALIDALDRGRVSACGLDVIDGEWMPDKLQHPLIQYAQTHDNVVITPHIGGITLDSRDMALQYTARQLIQHLQTKASARD